jgi:hypothetical protein
LLLQERSNKESVGVIDECLKLLFLFHTLAQSKKYQQDAAILLLEALLMVFYLSSDTVSQVEFYFICHLIMQPKKI